MRYILAVSFLCKYNNGIVYNEIYHKITVKNGSKISWHCPFNSALKATIFGVERGYFSVWSLGNTGLNRWPVETNLSNHPEGRKCGCSPYNNLLVPVEGEANGILNIACFLFLFSKPDIFQLFPRSHVAFLLLSFISKHRLLYCNLTEKHVFICEILFHLEKYYFLRKNDNLELFMKVLANSGLSFE
jgi:hypothetical protein